MTTWFEQNKESFMMEISNVNAYGVTIISLLCISGSRITCRCFNEDKNVKLDMNKWI